MQIGAVVLMAGMSRRMPEGNKLLQHIDGRTIAERTIGQLQKAQFSPILVITGHDSENIRAVLREHDVIFLHNEQYREGMGSSIAKAMQQTERWAGALIAMGDMPFLSVGLLRKLRCMFTEDPEAIVAPVYQGKRGQPVLFSNRFFSSLSRCSGDIGGKAIIKANPASLRLVRVEEQSIFWDVDTREALEKYRKICDN